MKKQDVNHEELRDGPLKERHCTDILCFVVFFAFVGAMVFLGWYGYQHGDPYSLIFPYDSAGNQCGRPDTATESYKYVYFLNPGDTSTKTRWKVCVSSCPDSIISTPDCYTNKWVTSCSFSANGTSYTPYPSSDFLNIACMPDGATEVFKQKLFGSELLSSGSDIIRVRWVVLMVLGIALGISILYLLVLRYFIGVFVWIVIAALIIFMSLIGGYFNYKIYDSSEPITDETTIYKYWAVSITCYVLALIFMLIMFCLRKRIELAIAIMKSATIFIDDVWTVLLVPIGMFFVSCAVLILWIAALVYLYSTGTIVQSETSSVFPKFEHDPMVSRAIYFELFGIIWINSFKIALLQFIVSFACCVWYFTGDKEHIENPIGRGLWNGVVFHLGSLAFGSFVLSLVIVLKWILIILTKVYEKSADANPVVVCICNCISCCVACFERFVKFLDHQAYIRIALTGENFCSAAQNAFEMIWENAGRFSALGGVSFVFNFLGKVLITCLSAYCGFFIVRNNENYRNSINSELGPTLMFLFVSYVISALFMGVYEMAEDTVIQAFILDEKIHGEDNTVYAPEPLVEYMKENRESK